MVDEKTETVDSLLEELEAACHATAVIIRDRSEACQLVTAHEIFQQLHERAVPPHIANDQNARDALLKKTLKGNEDLKELSGGDGIPRYYSTQSMSSTYARIMSHKQGDPLTLIADAVREHSALYPRPVSLEMFTNPPFELSRDEILACLQRMSEIHDYEDIAQTTTSIGTVFLYSTAHMEPAHASYLAEWIDVGQFENP